MSVDKEDFYVFLDFDGVLNDCSTIVHNFSLGGFLVKPDDSDNFNEQSIFALNFLLRTLGEKFNVKLVLSTTWRLNENKAIQVLKNNGLNYDGEFFSTPHLYGINRSTEIKKFINENDVKNNYLIIDDHRSILRNFEQSNYIKTNFINDCLDINKVLNYIDTNFPEIGSELVIEDM